MTKKIIIINGSGGTGKSTFCDICSTIIPTITVSTVDYVKQAYKLLGWNGEKTEVHRKALSDIKDISTESLDHPYNFIKGYVEQFNHSSSQDRLMFIHTREPNEIQRFVKEFGCITLLIKNSNVEVITSNHADAEVENYRYDYVIDNNGTLDDLSVKTKDFIKELFKP